MRIREHYITTTMGIQTLAPLFCVRLFLFFLHGKTFEKECLLIVTILLSWFTVILDDTYNEEDIQKLLDGAYDQAK